ncbi:MAG: hypothetical protein L6306_03145 [Planctomycetales bacterium]|nr:hypothetical protein [Planctomycetales bacterium]
MVLCRNENKLPQAALRFVRAYKPRFRNLMLRFLREKQQSGQNTWRIEDIQECIAMAYEVFEADVVGHIPLPEPDMATVNQAIEDYRNGRHRTTQEILDGLS